MLMPGAPIPRRLPRDVEIIAVEPGGEGRTATRVHNLTELRRALLDRAPLILLSPIFATASHPDWVPIPRMRAAAYARLAKRRLIALGGMDERRFAHIAPLGFVGWAGISAWERPLRSQSSQGMAPFHRRRRPKT